jgi:hypothetical protein
VRHPDDAKDWKKVKSNLEMLLGSIARQDNDSWRAIVVANIDADLPTLPGQVSSKRVDFGPNPLFRRGECSEDDFYDAFRVNKGRRVLAALQEELNSQYVMIVDDDDLVHRKIVSFVSSHVGSNGWYLDKGYIWPDGSAWLYRIRNFSELCGTSHIIRADLYNVPQQGMETDSYIRLWLGSHRFIQGILSSNGTPLELLPFPGAVYRVNHSENHSGAKSIFANVFSKERFKQSPFNTLIDARNVRPRLMLESIFFPGNRAEKRAGASPPAR